MYIYRIFNLSDECYIGSTTQNLKRRWQKHKDDYKRWKAGKTTKCNSFELFNKYGIGNCFYELLETVEEESQLKIRERYWIEYYKESVVNKVSRPVITEEERKKYIKEYREKNREQIAKQKSQRYTCGCGSTLRKNDKAKHQRTVKHKNFIQNKQ